MDAEANHPTRQGALNESLRKIFVSSLSVPTFLAQLMGYLPLSFDKKSNSFKLKWLSIPILVAVCHVVFCVFWVTFYLLHFQDFSKILSAQNTTKGTSSTLTFTYLGSLFLGAVSTTAIRVAFFAKRRDTVEFYNNLKHTVYNILMGSVENSKEPWDYIKWIQQNNREIKVVWIAICSSVIFFMYCFFVILYYVHFSLLDQHQSYTWTWFGSLSVVVSTFLTALYSADLIWLTRIIGLVRLAFWALRQHHHQSSGGRTFAIQTCDLRLCKKRELHSQEYFMRKFTEIKDVVNAANHIFAIPITINLAGIVCYWIVYSFLFLSIWTLADGAPLSAFIMSTVVMISMIFICLVNFWSFCNASQKLYEQANQCLNQLVELDWDAFSMGTQHKMQIFYQQNIHDPVLISPGNYFNISRKTLTSVAAVLITYIIVLLQFQLSE